MRPLVAALVGLLGSCAHGAAQPPPLPAAWVATWTAAPQPPPPGGVATYDGETLRLVVHTTLGGTRVRVRISNAFGDEPLHLAAAHVARRTAGAGVDPASDRPLLFDGRAEVTVAPHAERASDAADLAVAPLSDLAVSLSFGGATRVTTTHVLAQQTSYVSPKGTAAVSLAAFPVARTIDDWPFLGGVDVESAPGAYAVVAFGDSLVDGDGSTSDANHRFPDALAVRLARAGVRASVVNEGLIGNRLLLGSPTTPGSEFGAMFGPSAVERFERDALSQPGARVVVVRSGINDLGFPGAFAPASEAPTIAALAAGYADLVARGHRRGLRVLGTTLSPFEGCTLHAGYFTPEKEASRQALNAWIRGAGIFDGVVDFDRVLADPAHPARLAPAYDSGDHIHPNDAGYAALAEAVPGGMVAQRR